MRHDMTVVLESLQRDSFSGKGVSSVDLFRVHAMHSVWMVTPEEVLGRDSEAMKLYQEIFSNKELATLLGRALDAREAFWKNPYVKISKDSSKGARFHIDTFVEIGSLPIVKKWVIEHPDFFTSADRRICGEIRAKKPILWLASKQPGNPTGDVVYARTRV